MDEIQSLALESIKTIEKKEREKKTERYRYTSYITRARRWLGTVHHASTIMFMHIYFLHAVNHHDNVKCEEPNRRRASERARDETNVNT